MLTGTALAAASSFNSSKVRSKLHGSAILRHSFQSFNSSKVRSKPASMNCLLEYFAMLFQFLKGTIKTQRHSFANRYGVHVSIPQRYDQNRAWYSATRSAIQRVSIPQRYDQNRPTSRQLVHQIFFVSIPQRYDQNSLAHLQHPLSASGFQFLKGTIKTQQRPLSLPWAYRFQFLKGTIKTTHLLPRQYNFASFRFNSSKVRSKRLKPKQK